MTQFGDTIKLKNGQTLEIHHDECSINPIIDFDCATGFYFFHKRYNVGHDHKIDTDNYADFGELANAEFGENDLVMPVYAYSKRVFELSLTPFSCPWDSGQIGFAVVHEHIINKEFDGDRMKAMRCLKAELNTYNDYLNGRVYGYILKDEDGEEVDSCWGFFGDDPTINGIFDQLDIGEEEVAS